VQVLGLTLSFEDEVAIEFSVRSVQLRLQKVPHVNPQPYTVLGWSVTEIDQLVGDLKGRGVLFERYNFLDQDREGIWTAPDGAKIAWFKDPDGNLLSLTEPLPQ
jgi:hypothetical protein